MTEAKEFMPEEKRRPSIIRATCRFDSKIRVFSGVSDFVSAYLERDKNFFRKILFFHFLPSFFAEKWAKNGGIEYIVSRIAGIFFWDPFWGGF
jgi:hypothetical protein